MRITWRDGVTTAVVALVIVLERAFFHYDWAIVDSMSWTIGLLATLTAIGLIFSYVLDSEHESWWTVVAGIFTISTAGLTGFGLYYLNSDYVVLLMINAVMFWLVSVARHATLPTTAKHSHT